MGYNNPNPRQIRKRELYKLLKLPRTSETSARIKQLCKELDEIPPQKINTDGQQISKHTDQS